jgi:hypothetical protein
MFTNWMTLAFEMARLQAEANTVVALRMLRLMQGGKIAEREARRMVSEKGFAAAEAAMILATGGSPKKVVRRVRSRVGKNRRRLTKSR